MCVSLGLKVCYLGLLFELNCGELDIGIRISIIKIWNRCDCTWTGLHVVGIHKGGEMVGFWMREESGKYPRAARRPHSGRDTAG